MISLSIRIFIYLFLNKKERSSQVLRCTLSSCTDANTLSVSSIRFCNDSIYSHKNITIESRAENENRNKKEKPKPRIPSFTSQTYCMSQGCNFFLYRLLFEIEITNLVTEREALGRRSIPSFKYVAIQNTRNIKRWSAP